jgi:hypothetical protein
VSLQSLGGASSLFLRESLADGENGGADDAGREALRRATIGLFLGFLVRPTRRSTKSNGSCRRF